MGVKMQNIIELCEWFDDYTKKLVGTLYYEGSLENGKDAKRFNEIQVNSNNDDTLRKQEKH